MTILLQEYKLVFVGMDANGKTADRIDPYLATNLKNHNSKDKIPFVDTTDDQAFQRLVDFAKGAIADLRHALGPCACYGPIIRVDIMQMPSGDFVVNEIESLEALIDTQGNQTWIIIAVQLPLQRVVNIIGIFTNIGVGAASNDSLVRTFMVGYWAQRIEADLRAAVLKRGFL